MGIRSIMWATAALGVFAIAHADAAAAAPKHRMAHRRPASAWRMTAPPLTVQRRSFLDPGDNAPVGSLTEYVWGPMLPTNIDPTLSGGTSGRYGASILPSIGLPPGRPGPLVDF